MADEVSRLSLAVDSRSVRSAAGDLDKMAAAGGRAEKSAGGLAGAFRGLRAVLGPVAAALAVREIIRAADGYQQLNARIKLATKSVQEFATAQREVFAIAQRSGTGLDSVGNLYASLSRATQSLGVSQADLLGVVESINQALVISGGSAESAQAALVQLGQGFASGALRGEELNSVLEQAPRLAQAIADGLGVPIGKLREMGQAGELTAERVFSALQKSSEALQKEFEQMPITVSRATTEAGNSLLRLIGVIDQATGATGALALAISGVSRGVDNYIDRLTGQGIQKAQADVDDLRQRLVIMMQTKSEDHPMVKLLQNQLDKAVQTLQTLKREMSGDQTAAETARLRRMGSSPEAGPSLSSVAGIQEQIKKLTALRNAADINSDTFKRLSAEIKQYQDRLDKAVPSAKSPRSKSVAALKSAGLTYDEQITQRVGQLFEGADITRAKEYSDTLAKLDELFYSGAIGGDLYDSAVKKLTGSTAEAGQKANDLTEAERRVYDEMQRLSELLASTESAGIEEQRRDMELLTKALQDGLITEQEYLEAVSARLNLVAEQTKEAKSLAEEFGATFSSAFEEAVIQGKNLRGVLDGLAQDIARIVLRKSVSDPLANALSSGLDSLFGGFRAAGGPVSSGKGYIVGENGPEWFTPNSSGRITANHDLGGSVTVQIINNGQPMAVTRQQESTGADGGRLIQITAEALATDLAAGSGPLARAIEGRYGLRTSMA